MSNKLYKQEQIIWKCGNQNLHGNGETVVRFAVPWVLPSRFPIAGCREYGASKVEQVKQFKSLEQENNPLRQTVENLTLDKLIPQEGVKGNF